MKQVHSSWKIYAPLEIDYKSTWIWLMKCVHTFEKYVPLLEQTPQ